MARPVTLAKENAIFAQQHLKKTTITLLSLFRTNQELIGILLLPLILLFLGPAWKDAPVLADSPALGPLGTWTALQSQQHPILLIAISGVILFVLALLLNRMMQVHRLNREINQFSGLLLIIFALGLPVLKSQFPVFIGNFFLFLAVQESFGIYKKANIAGKIFNIGLFIGVASLFYTGFIFFLIWGIMAINTMRTPNIREQVIMISGALVVLFLAATWFFYSGEWSFFFDNVVNSFAILDWNLPPTTYEWILLSVYGLLLLLVLGSYSIYMSKKGIQSQKKISLLFSLLLLAGIGIFFTADFGIEYLLLTLIPLAILLAMSLTLIKPGPAEVLVTVILLGLIWLHYGTFLIGG